MSKIVEKILLIQRESWKNGHFNFGAPIDVKAKLLEFLLHFKHLNPKQKALLDELKNDDSLKYAKKLSSKATKAVRHYVVTLK